MENTEKFDVKKVVYKLIKESPKFKIVALSLALTLVSGIAIGEAISNGSSKSNNTVPRTNSTSVSTSTPVTGTAVPVTASNRITSVNTYKLNLKDFDGIVTKPFSTTKESGDYAVSDIKVEANTYKITTSNGEAIVSPIDSSILVDTNFKAREKTDSIDELSSFNMAYIKPSDINMEKIPTDFVSLEKVDDEDLFLIDTEGKRMLLSIDNCLPYRRAVKNPPYEYTNDEQYIGAYAYVGGSTVRFRNYIGSRDIKIGKKDFTVIYSAEEEGLCEFLVDKDNCIFIRLARGVNETVPGTKLGYTGSTGNFNMQYKNEINFYRNVENVFLGEDGLYYVITDCFPSEGISEELHYMYIIPPKCYSFAFKENTSAIPASADILDLSDYKYAFYNQNTFFQPITSKETKLVKIDNKYFYSFGQSENTASEINKNKIDPAVGNSARSIFDISSIAIGRDITHDQLLSKYTLSEGPLDFVFNIGGTSFGADSFGSEFDNKCIAYREVNLLGVNYYAIASQLVFTTKDKKEYVYMETLVPKEFVTIKGVEQNTNMHAISK